MMNNLNFFPLTPTIQSRSYAYLLSSLLVLPSFGLQADPARTSLPTDAEIEAILVDYNNPKAARDYNDPQSDTAAMETLKGENPDNPEYISTYYKDLDEDGVPDSQDQCPNSIKGYPVDAYGCELDSDRDGVFDRFDLCPDTPPNTYVNFVGCEGDEDKDGVFDSKDLCKGTPLGVTVDETGCANDDDQDGVPNQADRCPDSAPGAIVNIWGCEETNFVTTNIVFDTGSYAIRQDQIPVLRQNLSRLQTLKPQEVVLITGHTDDVGRTSRNLKLSWNRAQSTKEFFVQDFGVSARQVYVLGRGESMPVATNSSPKGRQTNRRIEIQIINQSDIPNDARENIPDSMKGYKRWDF